MIEVQVWEGGGQFDGATKIVFFERRPDAIYVHNFYTRAVKKVDDGFMIPPEYILTIPGFLVKQVFQALADKLDKQGVKTENDHKIAGTLEATKFHLRDLREMLKLKELP